MAATRELIESELFGHEKGALPVPASAWRGDLPKLKAVRCFWMKSAICQWNPNRLLRVLQEGEFTTVGGRQPIKTM